MKRRFGREMMWMTLPVLVLGGVGWFYPRWKAEQIRREGPLRWEVQGFELEKPTVAEWARGIGTKWHWIVTVKGRSSIEGLPSTPEYRGAHGFAHLKYRRKSQPAHQRVQEVVTKGYRQGGVLNQYIHTAKLPPDSFDFTLEGWVEGRVIYAVPAGSRFPKSVWARHGRRKDGLSEVEIEPKAADFKVKLRPSQVPLHRPVLGGNPHLQLVEARIRQGASVLRLRPDDTIVEVILKNLSKAPNLGELELIDHDITDEKGRTLINHSFNSGYMYGNFSDSTGLGFAMSFSSLALTAKHPKAHLKMWFSLGQSWPLEVIVPLNDPQRAFSRTVVGRLRPVASQKSPAPTR